MYRVREPDAEVSINAGSVGGMLTSWSAAYTEGMQETTIIRARHREKIFFMVFTYQSGYVISECESGVLDGGYREVETRAVCFVLNHQHIGTEGYRNTYTRH